MPQASEKTAGPDLSTARLPAWSGRFKAAFPAMAFFGGFLWDAFTLGRSITSLDLFLLLGYLAGAAGILLWLGRRAGSLASDLPILLDPADARTAAKSPLWLRTLRQQAPDLALQFFFGGLFSALVIFYFLSSSHLPSLLLVLGLASLLSVNEFLGGHYRRFTLSWTLFAACAILFLNFALPHLFRSVHPAWFYLSTALGFGAVVLLKRASPGARGSLLPAAGVAAAFVGLFVAGAIPPVPLVKKQLLICRELRKQDGRYTGRIEMPPFWAPWRSTESVVHQRPQEKVFCYTSVFSPPGIETMLYHVWQRRDPRTGDWKPYSRIGFPIRGGRKDGYRGYTWKQNLAAGEWRIRVETAGGRVVGLHRFRVEAAPEGYAPVFKDLNLP
jgi:hypothetical protein